MYRVFVYRNTGNLGDAIQTMALCRLLGTRCAGVYRDEPFPRKAEGSTLIANGWLGYRPPKNVGPAVFAGVHLALHEREFTDWMRMSGRSPVGARDPYTRGMLRCQGIRSATIGCATLTLDKYRGRRKGRYSVDGGSFARVTPLSHGIGPVDWSTQWAMAIERLDLLRRAELVYTSRLHVVLPCLAFGTPVVFPSKCLEGIEDKQRLTLLGELPFVFDEPVVADVSAMAERYVRFLEKAVGRLRAAKRPEMPRPPA